MSDKVYFPVFICLLLIDVKPIPFHYILLYLLYFLHTCFTFSIFCGTRSIHVIVVLIVYFVNPVFLFFSYGSKKEDFVLCILYKILLSYFLLIYFQQICIVFFSQFYQRISSIPFLPAVSLHLKSTGSVHFSSVPPYPEGHSRKSPPIILHFA